MSDSRIKSFTYKCRCGYIVNVYVDFGVPQESIPCRKCKSPVRRNTA